MKERHLWSFAFVLSGLLLAASCATVATVSNEPPRITHRGKFLEDRSMWPKHKAKKHYGIDYYTAPGIPIIAAADGTVAQIVNRDHIMPDI